MKTVGYRGILFAWLLAAALVSAQITFSRDWTGGKRAGPQLLDCNQFTKLCRHFMHELRQSLTSELIGKRHDPDKPNMMYDDE